ncbi:hypothetical protein [Deinococcus multiflagellatus]|uniref:Uncharacterized protein n=1 Tax=Deinococcus multiflagellatus TaxID=1656887 RepID=A0ABW1ZKM1_9DEIO
MKVKPAPRRPAPPKGSSPAEPHTPSTLRLFYALKVPATLAPPCRRPRASCAATGAPCPPSSFM